MNPIEWLDNLSESPGTTRDKQILEALQAGLIVSEFSEVVSTAPDHEARFYVSSDALYVPLDDGSRFRFPVTAKLAQQIADQLDLSLPTSKVMDLRHLNSIKLNATLLPAGPNMSTTTYSKQFNQKLEAKRKNQEGIISDVGKAWVIDNKLAFSKGAINHGFYDLRAPSSSHGVNLWQNTGGQHNGEHTDYSQVCILMKKTCLLDGQETTIEAIAKDPILSKLINYGGILRYLRQP